VADVKSPMAEIVRKGAVIRVGGSGEETRMAAPAYAMAFVDLRFDDGHVERWLGSGSIRDEDLVAYDRLVAWGGEVADEHPMLSDLGMAFSNLDRQMLLDAPVEIVIEWNAELPELQ
jgi:hypothetical protein